MKSVMWACGFALALGCGDAPMGPSSNIPGQNNNNNNPGGQNNNNNNQNNNQGSGPFTAVVDGQPWAAHALSIAAATLPGIQGGFLVTGAMSDGQHSKSINLTFWNVRGPGTYPIGVGSTVIGVGAQYGDLNGAWRAPDTGEAGSMTLTTLTPTRIAGTFNYTAIPGHRNMATGMRVVTNGRFDLPLRTPNNMIPAVADGAGSRISAMIGGKPYTAATVLPTLYMDQLSISSLNDTRTFSLTLDAITGPGVYSIDMMAPVVRLITVAYRDPGVPGQTCCWGSGNNMTSGSITVTSFTATRVKGTFQGRLGPQDKSKAVPLGPIDVSGDFDVGLQ